MTGESWLFWSFTFPCLLLSIVFSLSAFAFSKAAGDYLRGDDTTRAVAFHKWTQRVEARWKR